MMGGFEHPAEAWGWLTPVGIIADWRDDDGGPIAAPLSRAEVEQLVARDAGECGPIIPLALDDEDGARLRLTLDGRPIATVVLDRGRARLLSPRRGPGRPPRRVSAERRLLDDFEAAVVFCAGCGGRIAVIANGQLIAAAGMRVRHTSDTTSALCETCGGQQ